MSTTVQLSSSDDFVAAVTRAASSSTSTTLVLLPGTYTLPRSGMHIMGTKSLRIVATSSADASQRVLIVSSLAAEENEALIKASNGAQVVFENVHFRFGAFQKDEDEYDEEPEQDQDQDAVIEASGQGTVMHLIGCSVNGVGCHGVVAKIGAVVMLNKTHIGAEIEEDEDEVMMPLAGILVLSGARVTMEDKTIVCRARWSGAWVRGGTLEARGGCEFKYNGGPAINVDMAKSTVKVEDAIIQGNDVAIVAGAPSSTYMFAHTTFVDNERYGAIIGGRGRAANKARPVFSDCTFKANGESGAVVVEGASASFERCGFVANGRLSGSGIELHSAQAVAFDGCVFEGNKTHGIQASEGSRATLRQCTLKGNAAAGAVIEDAGSVVVLSATVAVANKNGLVVCKGASVQTNESRFNDNIGSGIRVENEGRVQIDDCKLAGNKVFGLYVVSAVASIAYSVVESNGTAGISGGWEASLSVGAGNRISASPTALVVSDLATRCHVSADSVLDGLVKCAAVLASS